MQRIIEITQDAAIANIPPPLESVVNAFAKDILKNDRLCNRCSPHLIIHILTLGIMN
jgi:hypothetical protein